MNDNQAVSTRDIIHAGFQEISNAKQQLNELVQHDYNDEQIQFLLTQFAHTNDPDTALANLVSLHHDLAERDCPLEQIVQTSVQLQRLLSLLGVSDALGMLMRTRPELVRAALEDPAQTAMVEADRRTKMILDAIDAQEQDGIFIAQQPLAQATTALRRNYREQLAAIMVQDSTATDPIEIQPMISQELSDLADAALEGALAIARHEVDHSELVRFTIIGMGKLGAQELNYVSDVDLIYVIEPAQPDVDTMTLTRIGTKIATLLQRVCQSVIPGVAEPILWQIDGALRPEGKDGALVRRLDAHQAYYEQWAENWEFQALLKARPVAGDMHLGSEYMQMISSFVWSASKRDNFVNDCQRMRERVEKLIPAPLKDREIKLGQGGLRDVEFTVQMLQLVHGRTDEALRTRSTLESLQALATGGYISRAQAKQLSWDYRFERVLEHRQQMWQLKRTHIFPDLGEGNTGGLEKKRVLNPDALNQNPDLHRLARAVHMRPEDLVEQYDEVRRQVRHLHNDIYYRPMLPISAMSPDESVVLSEQATLERYEAIGFADPRAAMKHVQALTNGVTRAAKINRILLPAVLRWLGEGQNPDMGLLFWRTLEEHFGSHHEYLGFLRDSPSAAQRLCHVLSNSRFLGEALNKSRESITWLGDNTKLDPRTRAMLDVQCTSIIERHSTAIKEAANALRALRRHEIERIGLGWMNGVVSDETMLAGMTDVYDAILNAALTWAIHAQMEEDNFDHPPAVITIIAMGRYGGREVNFSSDADIIIIYRPNHDSDDNSAHLFAQKVQEKVRMLLQGPVSLEPKIELDMDLRPEGKNGPLVRSYASCQTYYQSWASTWERQALLRARYAAGDEQLAQDFMSNIADPMRYLSRPLEADELSAIRKLKARMEAERLPRGVRRDRHLKLGKGGLSDVEWTVQLMQLQHAHSSPALRVNGTLEALDVLEHEQYIDKSDAATLREAWLMCTAARNGNYLWGGRINQADILPTDLYSLGGIAIYLGYEANHGQQFENDLLSVMRRAREVTDRLFYDIKS